MSSLSPPSGGVVVVDQIDDCPALFARHGVVRVRGALAASRALSFGDGVLAARGAWTSAFGGEQWSLGRAFYTHLEEGIAGEYFSAATASDALVEAHAPGLQALVRGLCAAALGAQVVPRAGFCGPGVHVFLPSMPVATRGGVVHFDTEGLTPAQIARRSPAATAVLMLRPPPRAGGILVWETRYEGRDHPNEADLAKPHVVVPYDAGDLVLLDAYRLHQIEPFHGGPRVSATAHLALRPDGAWESWF